MGFSVSPGYWLLGAVQQRQLDSLVDFGVSEMTRLCRCARVSEYSRHKKIQMYLGFIPSRVPRGSFLMEDLVCVCGFHVERLLKRANICFYRYRLSQSSHVALVYMSFASHMNVFLSVYVHVTSC